jgi:hypothetical protein
VVGAGVPFFGGVAGGLSFVSGNGFSAAPQNVQLNNAGTGALNWTAAVSMFRTSTVVVAGQFTDVIWLSVSATSGVAPSIVTVSVSPQGLPTGIYLGQILFQAATSSVTVPVSLVVVDSNSITFQQAPGLIFAMPVGSNPLSQNVTVASTGTSFNFIATAQTAGGGNWLQSTCSGGSYSDGSHSTPATCSISVNAATLSSRIYAGQIAFTRTSTGSAMIVPVTLTVGNASLTITSAHTGYFLEGQANAVYTLTVSNAVGAPSTSGTITVTEDLPNALSLLSMAGAGWSCSNNACTNGGVLGSGSSYQPITVTVSVAKNAPTSVTNVVSASGGGSATANASDITAIRSICDVNQYGTTTVADVQAMISAALGAAAPAYDLNHDGVVNVLDAQLVINSALGMGCWAP